MCREGAGSTAANGGEFLFFREEEIHVSGAVPQVAAQGVFRGRGTGAHHGYPPPSGGRGPYRPRLSLHRHTGYRQDHLRPDTGQGGELPVPGRRRALRPVRGLPGRGCRHHAGYHGAGRRQQQRRGSGPCAAGGGGIYPCRAEKAGVYHRRGAYALHPGLQRPAEDPGGAAGASDVHSGYHGAAQGTGHHSLPVPALLLQAHPAS